MVQSVRRGSRSRCEDFPVDELVEKLVGTAVVEDREGAQVFAADGQHLAVVITALVFDRADVARQECTVLVGQLPQPLQVEDDGRRSGGWGIDPCVGQQDADRDAVETASSTSLVTVTARSARS